MNDFIKKYGIIKEKWLFYRPAPIIKYLKPHIILKKSHLTSGISGKDNLCGRGMFHLKLGQIRLNGSVFLVTCLLERGHFCFGI